MINKIIDWIFMRYGIDVPKLDVVLALIILAGLIVLGASIVIAPHNSGNYQSGNIKMPLSTSAPSSGTPQP